MPLLQIQRPGQRDVAVEMALVEFVEDDDADAAQLGIGEHLPQQNSLGDEANARPRGGDFIEADLVTHFVAEPAVALLGHARGEHARGEPARLQHHDLAIARESVIEHDLRDLRGLARAGWRLEDEPRMLAQGGDQAGLQFEDGEFAAIQGERRIAGFRRADRISRERS